MKMLMASLLLLTSIAFGASEADRILVAQQDVSPNEKDDSEIASVVDAQGQRYFPEGLESYYVPYFVAMKEPSLMTALPKDVERMARFTLLRSFHAPLTVRITWHQGGEVSARAVRLQRGQYIGMPGKIDHEEIIRLKAGATDAILSLLAKADFWKERNAAEKGIRIRDGSQWIFEMREPTAYRQFDLLTPDAWPAWAKQLKETGSDPSQIRDVSVYQEVGSAILDLAKILPAGKELY